MAEKDVDVKNKNQRKTDQEENRDNLKSWYGKYGRNKEDDK